MGSVISVLVAVFHLGAFSLIAYWIRNSANVKENPRATKAWLIVGGVLANLIVSIMLFELTNSLAQALGQPLADGFLVESLPSLFIVQIPFALVMWPTVRRVLFQN